MKLEVSILIGVIVAASTWFAVSESEPNPSPSQHYGNLTTMMKQSIKSTVEIASYKYDDLLDRAQYIGDTLDRINGTSWQVYIFGKECTVLQESSTERYYSKWAWFSYFGAVNQCYYVFQTKKCKGSLMKKTFDASSNGEQWGSSFSTADQTRIKALIQEAQIRSTNPYTVANFIMTRLGSGYWSVALGKPQDQQLGYYACVVSEYWGFLWNHGVYNWSYIINRYA